MRKQDRYEVLNSDKLTTDSKWALVFDKVWGIVMKVDIQDLGDEQDE